MGKKNPIEKRLDLLKKGRESGAGLYSRFITEGNKKGSKKKKKNKEPKMSNRVRYIVTLGNFQFSLYQLCLELNGIDRDYFLLVSGNQVALQHNMKIDDTFKTLSKLDWENPAPIDGLMFRGRFMTYFLVWAIRNTDRVVSSLYKNLIEEGKRYQSQQKILEIWIEAVNTFVTGYLSKDMVYEPMLIRIEEMILSAKDKDYRVEELLQETEDLLRRRANEKEPGVEANNVTKMAYLLATDSMRFGDCPRYDSDYEYRDNQHTLDQVGGLGYAILRRRMKHKRLPALYKCFQEANPKIVSRFYMINEEAPEITVGLKALEFSKMFYEKGVRERKYVDQIM